MRRRILVAGAYGNGNLGDEAILVGILHTLKQRSPENQILVFSRDPDETVLVHRVRASRRNVRDLLATDELIIGGGELFQDVGFMAFKYSVLGLLGKLVGKRVGFFAVGVSNIGSKVARFFMWLCLNLSDGITVRDAASALRLRRIGIRRFVKVVDDPAVIVEPAGKEEVEELLKQANLASLKHSVLLGIVSQHVRNLELNKRTHLFFLRLLRKALKENSDIRVIFLPFSSHKDFDYDRDILYGRWLEKELGSDRYRVLDHHYTPQQMMGVLGEFDLIISTRFHPLVFSGKMHVPAAGVRVFEKVESHCLKNNLPLLDIDQTVELGSLLKS